MPVKLTSISRHDAGGPGTIADQRYGQRPCAVAKAAGRTFTDVFRFAVISAIVGHMGD